MSIRVVILCGHKWCGLGLALVVALVILSGAASVIRKDVERWAGCQTNVGVERGPFNQGVDAIAHAFPKAKVGDLFPADAPGRPDAYKVSIKSAAGKEHFTVFCDPTSGQVVGDTRASWLSAMVAAIADFHTELFLPDSIAEPLLGFVALALLAFSLSGLWLWWTDKRKIRNDLRADQPPELRVNALHRLLALISVPAFLLCAYTSLLFTWHWTRPAFYELFGTHAVSAPYFTLTDAQKLQYHSDPIGPQMSIDALIAAARAQSAAQGTDRVLRVTSIDSRETKPVKVVLDYRGNGDGRSGGVVFHLQRSTGIPAFIDDPRDLSVAHWLMARQWSLHTGRWWSSATVLGVFARGLWMLGAVLITIVALTGVASWWQQRNSSHPNE